MEIGEIYIAKEGKPCIVPRLMFAIPCNYFENLKVMKTDLDSKSIEVTFSIDKKHWSNSVTIEEEWILQNYYKYHSSNRLDHIE